MLYLNKCCDYFYEDLPCLVTADVRNGPLITGYNYTWNVQQTSV